MVVYPNSVGLIGPPRKYWEFIKILKYGLEFISQYVQGEHLLDKLIEDRKTGSSLVVVQCLTSTCNLPAFLTGTKTEGGGGEGGRKGRQRMSMGTRREEGNKERRKEQRDEWKERERRKEERSKQALCDCACL